MENNELSEHEPCYRSSTFDHLTTSVLMSHFLLTMPLATNHFVVLSFTDL